MLLVESLDLIVFWGVESLVAVCSVLLEHLLTLTFGDINLVDTSLFNLTTLIGFLIEFALRVIGSKLCLPNDFNSFFNSFWITVFSKNSKEDLDVKFSQFDLLVVSSQFCSEFIDYLYGLDPALWCDVISFDCNGKFDFGVDLSTSLSLRFGLTDSTWYDATSIYIFIFLLQFGFYSD